MGIEHLKGHRRQDKMAETAVQVLVKAEMVERIDKMSPVEVRIDAKHLAEDGLTYVDELLRKAAALANPVGTRKLEK
jgi:hypothetical protein